MSFFHKCQVLNNADYFLEALPGERIWREGFRENWRKCVIIPLLGGCRYFGSENLGVEAVAVVDLWSHCEDFPS